MEKIPRRERNRSASGWTLVAVGGVAVIGGFWHGSGGAAGAGIVLILGPVATWLMLRYSLARVDVRRIGPGSSFEGDTVEVSLGLTNRSPLPLFYPEVEDVFTPELQSHKVVLFGERIQPGESVEGRYHGHAILPRGTYRVGPLRVTLADPFGWFVVSEVRGPQDRIKVYPAVQNAPGQADLGRCVSSLVQDLVHGGPGESQEFFAVREYRPGDPLRRVHWGLTAHRGVPVVREFARISTGDVTIFLDRSREALLGIGRGSSMEHAVKVCAALSAKALQRGHRVSVIAGLEREHRLPASAGRDWLHQILELLVHCRPNADHRLGDVFAAAAGSVLPGSVAVVMLSPCSYRDRDVLDRISAWRRSGVHVVAVVFDASSFQQLWATETREDESARFVEDLRRRGIRAHLLPCSADLAATLTDAPAPARRRAEEAHA